MEIERRDEGGFILRGRRMRGRFEAAMVDRSKGPGQRRGLGRSAVFEDEESGHDFLEGVFQPAAAYSTLSQRSETRVPITTIASANSPT